MRIPRGELRRFIRLESRGAEPQTRQVKYSRPWLSKRELQLEPETIAEIPVEAIEDGRNDGIVDRTAVHEPHSRQSLS